MSSLTVLRQLSLAFRTKAVFSCPNIPQNYYVRSRAYIVWVSGCGVEELGDVDESGFVELHASTGNLPSREFNFAIFESKKSVITTDADIVARPIFLAALTNNNLTSLDRLAAIDFNSQHLGLRVSQIFSCSPGFYVGHRRLIKN